MSNHAQRLLMAVIGIPLILLVCNAGGVYFFIFVAAISMVGLHEFYKLAEKKGGKPPVVLCLLAGVFVNLSFYHVKLRDFVVGITHDYGISIPFPTQTQLLVMTLIVSLVTLGLFELFRNKGSAILNLSTALFGIMYVSLFFGMLIGLRELFVPFDFPVSRYFPEPSSYTNPMVINQIYQWGGYTVIAVLGMIWVCDSSAYYFGRAFGNHKLFPRVSPNKTWEGAIAGFIAAIAASIVARYVALEYLSFGSALIIGIMVGVFGQMGDLFESLIKRDAAVKDSSALIPGHGGVLDRFDSLLFVSPVVYLYIDYILF